MGSHDLRDFDPHQLCPECHLGQCHDQLLSATSQSCLLARAHQDQNMRAKNGAAKNLELCGLYEYIFNCRDKDGVFDMSPNLPTDLSVQKPTSSIN